MSQQRRTPESKRVGHSAKRSTRSCTRLSAPSPKYRGRSSSDGQWHGVDLEHGVT
jgi:hypothetical protein